ncbi:protein diaphanous homolog 1-like [Panicum virgatum]|uniref:protein diaphanous homolog 1-like n=1 Tax=Panicum virgatum TaxID=38727 RepID=UPI0019D57900|nr:protein diaphanous homolog 1-like [Panicum virgatum]
MAPTGRVTPEATLPGELARCGETVVPSEEADSGAWPREACPSLSQAEVRGVEAARALTKGSQQGMLRLGSPPIPASTGHDHTGPVGSLVAMVSPMPDLHGGPDETGAAHIHSGPDLECFLEEISANPGAHQSPPLGNSTQQTIATNWLVPMPPLPPVVCRRTEDHALTPPPGLTMDGGPAGCPPRLPQSPVAGATAVTPSSPLATLTAGAPGTPPADAPVRTPPPSPGLLPSPQVERQGRGAWLCCPG